MTNLEAVHAAVLAEPHDNFHRLAYADLCEEHGAVHRAELIRLQLEFAEGYVAVDESTIARQLNREKWWSRT